MILSAHHTLLCKFHMFYNYQPRKWQTFFQAWNILISRHYEEFQIRCYFIFAINQFWIMKNLHLWKNFLRKRFFFALFKKISLSIAWPSIKYIYIYIMKTFLKKCILLFKKIPYALIDTRLYIYIYIYIQ